MCTRDIESWDSRGGVWQRILHHLTGQSQIVVESSLVGHLSQEPKALDGTGHCKAVDDNQRGRDRFVENPLPVEAASKSASSSQPRIIVYRKRRPARFTR